MKRNPRPALQLYSIRDYIAANGLPRALEEIAKLGYEGVEFAGYWGFSAPELAKMLAASGLVACGTHLDRSAFAPDKVAATCDFERAYGNTLLVCPGGGNMPPGVDWGHPDAPPSAAIDDFVRRLCDDYNRAAADCASRGCRVGLHNHAWEFSVRMTDGTTFWDYFFRNTDPAVAMEQDVGWTAAAGVDPAAQYRAYPHRSPTLHAKENGRDDDPTFDAILGRPGASRGVDWDAVLAAASADGVKWLVVECEKHCDGLSAAAASIEFLRARPGYR